MSVTRLGECTRSSQFLITLSRQSGRCRCGSELLQLTWLFRLLACLLLFEFQMVGLLPWLQLRLVLRLHLLLHQLHLESLLFQLLLKLIHSLEVLGRDCFDLRGDWL